MKQEKLLLAGLATALLTLVFVSPGDAAYFEVTRTDDQVDTNPGDGACVAQNGGGCSLRATIQEANALSGNDYIYLPPGKFPARVPNRYSAAIDGGNSFVCLPDDQWGQVRPHDDNGDNVAIDEVGAIEALLIFTDGFEHGNTAAW